ncbi:MAG: tetratricopeptide repeat protein [Bacteroidota bacterium]
MRRLICAGAIFGGVLLVSSFPALSQTPDKETKFRLAQALEQGGDYERAAALYQELLKGEPANAVYFDALQRTWIQLKRYDDVILIVNARLKETPSDLNLRSLLGSVLYRAGREKEASAEWNTAIAVDPRNQGTYRVVASALTENRLLDRAADVYRRGRAAVGDSNLFTLELSQLYAASMDYGGATRELLRWLGQNPTQLAFVQSRIASWTGREEARSAAMAVVRVALTEHEDLSLLELWGWLAMEGKNYDQALDVYRRIDDLSHANGSSLMQFADRAFRDKAFPVAARAYQEAIALPIPTQRRASAEYGYACALKEMSALADTLSAPGIGIPATESQPLYTGAIARFRNIIDSYPRTEYAARSYYQIGLIQFEKYIDLDGALASFGHVLEAVQGVSILRFDVGLMMGKVFVAKGDTSRALVRFTMVAAAPDALPDQSDEANFRIAEIEYFGGRFDDAMQRLDGIAVNLKADYANDALRLQAFLVENLRTAPEALRMMGRGEFLGRQGKNTEATAILQEVVRNHPQAPLVDDALLVIASLQSGAGLLQDAVGTYERLLTELRDGSIALDRAQFKLGELYQYGLRSPAKAIAAYEKLLADYPTSVLAGQARLRIRRLRGDSF